MCYSRALTGIYSMSRNEAFQIVRQLAGGLVLLNVTGPKINTAVLYCVKALQY